MACMSTGVPVFRNGWLSTRTGFASRSTSGAIQSTGNKVVTSITVLNATSAATATFYLDGSYDGLAWKQIGSVTQSTFGYNTLSQASLDYAFLRVRVELTGTDQDLLFDVSLAFTCQ